MKHHHKMLVVLLGTYCALAWSVQRARSQEKAASSTVQVHLVITDMGLRDDGEVPILRREDVKVKQGKTMRQVAQLIAAQGDNAALQLFILIDDTLSSTVGNIDERSPRQQQWPSWRALNRTHRSEKDCGIP